MAGATDVPPLLEGRLSIDVRHGPEEVVLALGGELDMASAPRLRSALAGVLLGGVRGRVVLDLAELDFVDAVGLGCIARSAGHLDPWGGALVVRDPSPPARRLLELCDLGALVC